MEQYQPKYPEGIPYWVKRIQQANSLALTRSEAQTQEQLRQLYADQSQKLYAQIMEVFNKVIGDIETEQKIYTNDLFRTNTYHLLLEYFNDCAQKIGGEQVKITDEAVLYMYKYSKSVVESFAPKGLMRTEFQRVDMVKPNDIINTVWCMDGKDINSRIWQGKQGMIKDLIKTLSDYGAQGSNPFKIATALVDRLNVDLYSAYRIARTETAHAQIKGQTDKYKEMGFARATWLATDGCPECAELDGKEFALDEIQWMIPRHPNCECSFLLVV